MIWNNSPYLGKYPSSVSRTCLCCPLLFLKTTFFLLSAAVLNIISSEEPGVYSEFTFFKANKIMGPGTITATTTDIVRARR